MNFTLIEVNSNLNNLIEGIRIRYFNNYLKKLIVHLKIEKNISYIKI